MEKQLVSFISLLSVTSSLHVYGPCPHLEKCSCKSDEASGGILISCRDITDKDVEELPLSNVTAITIADSDLMDPSVLRNIRRKSETKTAIDITILFTEIKHFSWEWAPENTGQVTLSNTGTINFFSKKTLNQIGTAQYECGMAHIKYVRSVHIVRQKHMKAIPTCLPSSLQTLGIHTTDLSVLGDFNNVQSIIQWPASLRFLHLGSNNITKLSDKLFSKPPLNLTWITLKDQPIVDSSIILTLPAQTLIALRLQNTSIKVVPENHFAKLTKHNILRSLSITRSKLERIPRGTPYSITILDFSDNQITTLDGEAFAHLKKLKFLDLRRNRLHFVPPGLPKSLEQINLEHNQITSCHAEAFVGMSHLNLLILSHNSLKIMPKNLPRNLQHYSVAHNKISNIGPESNYDFCARCAMFNIASNPWACNTYMINFLVWTNKQRNRTLIDLDPTYAKCASGIPGLNDMVLGNIMLYIQKYKRLGCFYNVTVLNCTANHMTELPKMFGSSGIQQVYIVDNPMIGNVHNSSFSMMKRLTELELRNIGLTTIPKGLPMSILRLSLSDNKITELSNEDGLCLNNLTKVETIDLANNQLTTMPLQYIQLANLKLVNLKGNPLICDCDLWPYTVWARIQRDERAFDDSPMEESGIRGTCAAPVSKAGSDITELYGYYKNEAPCMPENCDWDFKTPVINCSYSTQMEFSTNHTDIVHVLPRIPKTSYWMSIDLSGLKLKSSDIKLSDLKGLREVKLSNNSLNTIPISGLPETVVDLILDNNNISSLPTLEGVRRHFKKLECVDLRNNSISYLDENDVRLFPYLRKLRLHDNPLVCDCKLGPLKAWIAANNDNPSVMRNHGLEKLKCYGPKRLVGKLIANLTGGEYCPTINVAAVTGGLVGAVIFLIILAVLCNVYMHRQCKIRENEAILQGFRELIQREAEFNDADSETGVLDNERFKYDAFVSYSPHDEDTEFAALLVDRLEVTHRYNLCIHERDFVPGVGIADNIVECIGASKRIILILSRSFVSSPWCQYEVQVALTELHQKRKSKLLIPILLEELDGKVEGSVKTFLSLTKGIKIPGNHRHSSWELFWNEIVKAMPEEPISEHAV